MHILKVPAHWERGWYQCEDSAEQRTLPPCWDVPSPGEFWGVKEQQGGLGRAGDGNEDFRFPGDSSCCFLGVCGLGGPVLAVTQHPQELS